MRAVSHVSIAWALMCVAALACSGPVRTTKRPAADIGLAAPGLRLPDTFVPLSYDLHLDIAPDAEIFQGEVAIDVRVVAPTDHVWLHADHLAISTAKWDGGTLTRADVAGEQMVAFRFGRIVQPGTITLRFTFSGDTNGDQEGLFRQRAGGWYVFSQGEAVFTRRITPCFDEPRFKTPWRVTLVVPKQQVALSNMPEQKTTVVESKKEVVFAPTPPMPSYLLAIAVGPFELVDAGVVGRNKIPVRVAVPGGKGARAGVVAARLPALVDAIEQYMDEPLPVAKLDLVVVPAFFGAMENPGLITFDEPIVIGDPKRESFANYFTFIAAHELSHQWFGNRITPAWWDDLWVSEAFASWLGDKLVRGLQAYDDPSLRLALARREALDADRETGAKPLWRHVTTTAGADEGFDSIAYAKGQVVLSSMEAYVGADRFRTWVRALSREHFDHVVSTETVVASFSKAEGADAAGALKRYLLERGTPVVELALRCDSKPSLVASTRGGSVPFCVAFGASVPGGATTTSRTCALVGSSTELPIGASCPTWVRANPDGAYVHTRWTTHGPRGPSPAIADLDPLARIVTGDDLAASVNDGQLPAASVLPVLRALASSGDPYGELGALAIARAIDPLVDDAVRTSWVKWLSVRFASRLVLEKKPPAAADNEVVQALLAIVPAESFAPAVTRRAFTILDKGLPDMYGQMTPALVRLAAMHGGDKLFDRIALRARLLRNEDVRDTWLESLGELGAAQIPKAIALVTGPELPAEDAWTAVARYLERPATRSAAWRAVKAALPAILRRMSAAEAALVIDATSHLCDKAERDDVEATFAGTVKRIDGGPSHLATALAAIDRCITLRAKLGNVAAALTSTP
jgi:cytosol alanyl aminopeptidase